MRISPQKTEAKLAVARMVAGLRHALCKKEIHETPNDERLRFFQAEESRRKARFLTEKEHREWWGKNNRAQIRSSLGGRISAELKKQGLPKLDKPNEKALELLGCSVAHFFLHIEKQFREGMDWYNFGKWVLDHILPCSSFDFKNEQHLKSCFHFSNFQPLWKHENMEKSDKIYEAYFSHSNC